MDYEKELKFLYHILDKCHMQTSVINRDMLENLNIELKNNTIYKVRDGFYCHHIFMELPGCEEDKILAIGPYLNEDLTYQQILEEGEKLNIAPNMIRELEIYYSSLPAIKEEHLIFSMVTALADVLYGGSDNYSIEEVTNDEGATFTLNEMLPKSDTVDNARKVEIMEQRYAFENELMKAVSTGNEKKAELMLTSFSTMVLEHRMSDKLRNIKNYCIIMNTLLRKAAENGGVHPVYLDKVSSGFAQKIEAIHTVEMMPNFMLEIMRTYCKLVRKHTIKDYTPLVQKTIIKIESDIASDLSLNALAKFNNVSTGYLSALFKKETGQTLTDYVNNKRVAHSKQMLKDTNLQIQTIAQYCGILDLHYFCRIFKKATGTTPTEYRRKHLCQ